MGGRWFRLEPIVGRQVQPIVVQRRRRNGRPGGVPERVWKRWRNHQLVRAFLCGIIGQRTIAQLLFAPFFTTPPVVESVSSACSGLVATMDSETLNRRG